MNEVTLNEKRIGELIGVLQTQYVVFVAEGGAIQLKNWEQTHTFHTFKNWAECEAWAIEQEWD